MRPLPIIAITSLDDVVRHYWMRWEIEGARKSSDPAATLVAFATHSQRGASSPEGYRWETRTDLGRIQAWFNHRPWNAAPDVSLSLAAFARRTVELLIAGVNQLRMEI